MAKPVKIRLGEVLMQQKLLTEEQLKQSLEEQKKSGRKLGRIFVDNGFVTEEGIAEAVARVADTLHQSQVLQRQQRGGERASGDRRRGVSARWCWRIGTVPCWWGWRIRPTCSAMTKSRAS